LELKAWCKIFHIIMKEKLLSIITKDVITADRHTTAMDIAKLMEFHDIGVVVIVDAYKIMGIVSERDIARRIVAKGLSSKLKKAKDFMTKDVISVDLKEGLNKVYETLSRVEFRHLPITEDGKLIGITSRRDMLDILSQK